MTHRERVLKTFRFQQPDRLAYDLMEGRVWPDLLAHFQSKYGLDDPLRVQDFLDTDFRWALIIDSRPEEAMPKAPVGADGLPSVTKEVARGPLAIEAMCRAAKGYAFHHPTIRRVMLPAGYTEHAG